MLQHIYVVQLTFDISNFDFLIRKEAYICAYSLKYQRSTTSNGKKLMKYENSVFAFYRIRFR